MHTSSSSPQWLCGDRPLWSACRLLVEHSVGSNTNNAWTPPLVSHCGDEENGCIGLSLWRHYIYIYNIYIYIYIIYIYIYMLKYFTVLWCRHVVSELKKTFCRNVFMKKMCIQRWLPYILPPWSALMGFS